MSGLPSTLDSDKTHFTLHQLVHQRLLNVLTASIRFGSSTGQGALGTYGWAGESISELASLRLMMRAGAWEIAGTVPPHLCQELVQPPCILSQDSGTQVAMALYLALVLEELSRAGDDWCSGHSLERSRVIFQGGKQVGSHYWDMLIDKAWLVTSLLLLLVLG